MYHYKKIREYIDKLFDAISFESKYLIEEGSDIPSSYSIDTAIKIIIFLSQEDILPDKIVTTVEEGIALVFKKDDQRLFLELYNEGDAAYIIEDTKDKILLENKDIESQENTDKIYNVILNFYRE